jgi:cell pole-organizing protein PopZ
LLAFDLPRAILEPNRSCASDSLDPTRPPRNSRGDKDARMTQPAKAQEPSMEEILASIRRIIADEEAVKPQTQTAPEPLPGRAAAGSESPGASKPAAFRAPAESVEPDALEAGPATSLAQGTADPAAQPGAPDLAQTMPASDADDAAFSDIDAHANDDFEDAPAAPENASRSPGGHLRAIEAPEPLLSAEATAAVNSAFGTLAHTVLVQNARTLEDLVREMLRPMLKTWLDDNLPNLVERLVRAEIERVSRGHPG